MHTTSRPAQRRGSPCPPVPRSACAAISTVPRSRHARWRSLRWRLHPDDELVGCSFKSAGVALSGSTRSVALHHRCPSDASTPPAPGAHRRAPWRCCCAFQGDRHWHARRPSSLFDRSAPESSLTLSVGLVAAVTPVTPENSRGADLPLRLATWRKTAAGRLRALPRDTAGECGLIAGGLAP